MGGYDISHKIRQRHIRRIDALKLLCGYRTCCSSCPHCTNSRASWHCPDSSSRWARCRRNCENRPFVNIHPYHRRSFFKEPCVARSHGKCAASKRIFMIYAKIFTSSFNFRQTIICFSRLAFQPSYSKHIKNSHNLQSKLWENTEKRKRKKD